MDKLENFFYALHQYIVEKLDQLVNSTNDIFLEEE